MALTVCSGAAAQPAGLAERASRKFDLIASGRAKPGAIIAFTQAELNAWTNEYVAEKVRGVREPEIVLGEGTATVSALVDFAKLKAGEGNGTNPLLGRLIDGERHLRVHARLESSAGQAAVHLTSVEIGGAAVSGVALDLIVNLFFRPMFPNARINEPFEIGNNVERIKIHPRGVHAVIGKQSR